MFQTVAHLHCLKFICLRSARLALPTPMRNLRLQQVFALRLEVCCTFAAVVRGRRCLQMCLRNRGYVQQSSPRLPKPLGAAMGVALTCAPSVWIAQQAGLPCTREAIV